MSRRSRLEAFEQTCSVDQRTSRCAGPPSACRESILGILGTMLRTNCACKDTSPSKFYDCMGWQRVFWFNSCVGEYNATRLGLRVRYVEIVCRLQRIPCNLTTKPFVLRNPFVNFSKTSVIGGFKLFCFDPESSG